LGSLNTNRTRKPFENSEQIGAFADISFEITGDVEAGSESVLFDTRIHYVDEGEGTPLLLVHGIGQSLYTWHNSISFFASHGYRVIAPDLAGHGYSAHPNIYYTVEEQFLVLRALLDALGIETACVAAFSTGCLSAVCLAAENPDMVSRMALVSPGGPNECYPFFVRALTTWMGHRLMRFLISEGSMKTLLHGMYFDATKLTDDVAAGYAQPFKNTEVRETLVMTLLHFDDTYARALLKGIRQPTLVFSGMDDHIHPDEMVRVYAVTIPGARHIRLRNCGHFVHEEKHAKFNAEALAFFNDPVHLGYGRTRSI
jgi:pimeloyl-ACP methyl ester carboxylesterase